MRRVISAALLVGLVSACGNTVTPADTKKAQQELDERGTEISQAWPETENEWSQRLVLLDSPVKWLDDTQLTEQQSAGFHSGYYQGDVDLPEDSPPDTVEFEGGVEELTIYDAETAYRALASGGTPPSDCPRESRERTHGDDDDAAVGKEAPCGVLTVTGIELDSEERWTNHGLIEMPVWMYTVEGVDEPISQLAFDAGEPEDTIGVDVSHMATMEELNKADQLRAVSESKIVFTVATGDCRTNERGLVHETAEVIVVGGISDPTGETECNGSYGAAPVEATLQDPVAERMIVDASSGEVLTHRGPFPESPSNY